MEKPKSMIFSWAKIAVVTGVFAIFAYFFSVVFKFLPISISRLFFFSIGPLSIVSVVALYKVLSHYQNSITLQLGTIFHIIAGSIMNMMAVVQATQFTTLGKQINSAKDLAHQDMLEDILWGVNVVQSGLDISWDIFISIGTILLGIALCYHPNFGKIFGGIGIVVSSSALIFNLFTFPTAPAAAGLIDLGPGVGLWYAAVIIQLWRSLPIIKKALNS